MNGEYPELLADLAARAEALLLAEGMTTETAKTVSFKLAESIRQHWGGQLVYVPTGHGYEINERDRAIWEQFNGRNQDELARTHEVTVVHVYRIIKKMRQAAMAKSQADLFQPAAVLSSAPTGSRSS